MIYYMPSCPGFKTSALIGNAALVPSAYTAEYAHFKGQCIGKFYTDQTGLRTICPPYR